MPSGLKATAWTQLVWPRRTWVSVPGPSQTLTVPSVLPQASRRRSRPNATHWTAPGGVGQVVQQLPGRSVPDLDGPVPAGRGQQLAVAAERHACDPGRVPGLEDGQLLAGCPVPDPDGAVRAARGEVPAVGAERHPEIGQLWSLRTWTSLPVVASQTRTAKSKPAEATCRPSGLNATQRSAAVVPESCQSPSRSRHPKSLRR